MKQMLNNIILVISVIGLVIMFAGYSVMFLWNWLMPTIFDLPTITFWQSIGLQVLTYLLFSTKEIKKQ